MNSCRNLIRKIYMNRFEKIYNIFKKYDKNRYNLLKKKYKITQNKKLIF